MAYQFEFRPYQRRFARSLTTHHGIWDIREGIILRLTDETGNIGWGEIAPLPWFGTETLAQALEFCHQLPDKIAPQTIFLIPDTLPACQFGFESAWEENPPRSQAEPGNDYTEALPRLVQKPAELTSNPQSKIQNPLAQRRVALSKIPYSGLLLAGEAALNQWQTLWNQGYRTFKWKIGIAPIQQELKIFTQLTQAIPKSAKLRLDANGGLKPEEAEKWLQICQHCNNIEFLEQPLPVNQFSTLLNLSTEYSTPIALDESVATLKQMAACYQQGWRGIFVIKPCIAGFPSRLRQFCQNYNIDAVFSSVFETAIGRQAALKLAAELSHPHRAIGFGINHWFAEEDETWLEQLWNTA
jgi:o-succinylbenzoate synthase